MTEGVSVCMHFTLLELTSVYSSTRPCREPPPGGSLGAERKIKQKKRTKRPLFLYKFDYLSLFCYSFLLYFSDSLGSKDAQTLYVTLICKCAEQTHSLVIFLGCSFVVEGVLVNIFLGILAPFFEPKVSLF